MSKSKLQLGEYEIISFRDRLMRYLREEGCTMAKSLSGIIEYQSRFSNENLDEIVARWKVNKPEWFRGAA